MFRFSLFLILAAVASAQPQAADILNKVRETYSHLNAIHVVATRTDAITRGSRNTLVDTEYEYAAKFPGKFRAWTKRGDIEALSVSDGSTTWKALPKAKQWMKLEVASTGDDEETGGKPPKDLRASVAGILTTRYMAIPKAAENPELRREDTYNLKSRKVHCYVVRTRIKQQQYEFWIDKSRYLVLKDIQQGPQESPSGAIKAAIQVSVKEVEENSEVDDSVFSFTPGEKWAEVETLTLPEEKPALLTGRPAIDFTLKSLEGAPLQLASLRGKVIVLDFWASWCPPCRRELPVLEKLRGEFGESVQFIGVNDEDPAIVKGFRKSNGYEMAVLMDRKREVNRQYNIRAIPTLLVIDAQGTVRQHWVGSRSEKDLRKAIQAAGTQ